MVELRLTLISVEKPWSDVLPEREICHSLLGLPGFVFSQAISLATGASQGAAAAFVAGSHEQNNAKAQCQCGAE
jgi:hypothetical protein